MPWPVDTVLGTLLDTLLRALLVALCVGLPATVSFAQTTPRAEIRLESRAAYAGVPFTIAVNVEGLEAEPTPSTGALTVPGVAVRSKGVSSEAIRGWQSLNGRRTQYAATVWTFRWEFVASKEGRIEIPPIRITQGNLSAQTKAAALDVDALPKTDQMSLRLEVPNRPVWLGETVPARLVWDVPTSHGEPEFQLPFLAMDDLTVSAPPAADNQKTYSVSAGGRDIQLPYAQTTANNRRTFTFELLLTPRKVGALTIPASTVVTTLASRRDWMGNPIGSMVMAGDSERTLDVRPLPLQQQPAGFSGVVATRLGITVQASKSVVELGEPVTLSITLRGAERLDHVALGRLQLPANQFSVPSDAPPGTVSEDGLSKTFTVDIQVIDAATEIPAIPFAYFDPEKGAYAQTLSQPIALSVRGGKRIGAADVRGSNPVPSAGQQSDRIPSGLVGVDLALSDGQRRSAVPRKAWLAATLALYVLPLLILLLTGVHAAWRRRRDSNAPLSAARNRLRLALSNARKQPSREAFATLRSALTEWSKLSGTNVPTALLTRLETAAYSNQAQPTSATELVSDVDALMRARPSKASLTIVWFLLGAASLSSPLELHAATIEEARALYRQAIETTDPTLRQPQFAAAQAAFASATDRTSNPAQLTDWGNAALAAGDRGTATLLYLRANRQGGDARAEKNVAWLRAQLPTDIVDDEGEARQVLFFTAWPRSGRWLLSGLAFAVMIILVSRRATRWFAAVPALLWGLVLFSLLYSRDQAAGVITQATQLRAADAAGAPTVRAEPLPEGCEVQIEQRRDGWVAVRVGSHRGWLPVATVTDV